MKNLFIFLTIFTFSLNNIFAQHAIQFDGVHDYIEIPDNSYLDLDGNFTIEVWVQPMKILGTVNILNKGMCSGDNYSYNLAAIDGRIDWWWYSSGSCTSSKSWYESIDSVLAPDLCTYISIVHTNISVNIFLNGVEIPGQIIFGGTDFSIYNSTANVRIGVYKAVSSFQNYFWGKVDELKIWNYAKNQNEISSDMYAIPSGNESGLIAYYDMEDSGSGSSITITNKAIVSGNQINGITYGTTTSPYFSNTCISTSNDIKNNDLESNIFTNPTDNLIHIDKTGNYQIQIFDILGKKLISQKNLCGISTINVANLEKGTYIIKIFDSQKIATKKFIKE